MRFKHHRCAAAHGLADHQAGQVLLFEQLARLGIGLAVVDQLLDHRLEQVHLHRLQVAAHSAVLGVLLRQRRQQRLQRQGNGFFVQMTQLVIGLALPLRQARQLFVETLFELRNILVKTLALLFGQLRKLGFIQCLAVAHRRKGDVAAVAVQGHAFFQRQTLDHIQRAVIPLIKAPVDGAFTLLIGRVLKHRRKGRQQVVDQTIDVSDERRSAAGGQLQRPWLARVIEVIDIHPVTRRLQALAFGFEVAFDERKTPGTGFAHHKYVVTRTWHGHAKLQGFDRTFLAENAAKRLQIIGGREAELFSGKRTGQRVRRETQAGSNRIRHRASLHRAGQMPAFWRWPYATGKAHDARNPAALHLRVKTVLDQ